MKNHTFEVIRLWQSRKSWFGRSYIIPFAAGGSSITFNIVFHNIEELVGKYNRKYHTNIDIESVRKLMVLL